MASFEAPADDADQGDDEDDNEDNDDGLEPSKVPDEDDQDGEEPDEGDDDAEEGEEGEEDPNAQAAAAAISDDAKVQVTINGEAQEFTVGSLKRLAGQEASLTRKSQEVELVGGRAAAALQAAIEVVQEDLEPYSKVDWLVLQSQMEPEEFAWHRENAQKLDAKFKKLVGAAKGFEQTMVQRRQNVDKEAAQAAIQELTTDIPGWNDQVYGDILSYGASAGLDADDLATVTNPKVLKIIRKAMLYDKAQKVATKKVKEVPTKVLKTGNRTDNTAKAVTAKKAEKRLALTGSEDDAVAALLGRWG